VELTTHLHLVLVMITLGAKPYSPVFEAKSEGKFPCFIPVKVLLTALPDLSYVHTFFLLPGGKPIH
jgi:hypothetical protein